MRIFSSFLALTAAISLLAQNAPTDSAAAINPDTIPTTPVAGSQISPIRLTLDECIEIALSDNPTIQVAEMEIQRYDYSKKEVLGQLLPTVGFSAAYNRTLAKQVMYMNMGGFGGALGGDTEGEGDESSQSSRKGGDDGIKMGLDNSWQMGFSASVPVIAPQLWKSLKLSDSAILASIETARASRLSLVNQVKSAYYTLLLAQDSYKVVQENMDMAKFTADLYKKKFSLGAASEYDVLRTDVAVKNVEPDLLQAEIAIKQAKLQLIILMGMDPDVTIEATDSLQAHEKNMYENSLSIDRSIHNNTDLRMLDIQTEQLGYALDVQKAAWWPTVALSASYSWSSSSDGSPFKNFRWSPYSMIGLSLNLPIFEGGQRWNKIKQARIQLDEMTYQRDNLTRSINVQVDLAIDNINKNIRQIATSSENVKQADRAHDIAKRSFEIGAASYLDLRDSEIALTQTRLTYYQSIYNYLIAMSELQYLLGNANIEKYTPARKIK